MNRFLFVLCTGYILCCAACTSKYETEQHPLTPFRLLALDEAKEVITKDSIDHFFEEITSLDMAIQIKEALDDSTQRSSLLTQYKDFLREDLLEFLNQDAEHLKKCMKEALDLCYQLHPELNLPEIELIKTKGGYYGNGVYYTRMNRIIVPVDQLAPNEEKDLILTLIHEIFHIYSRYNPEKRDQLYAAIGYNPIQKLKLSDFLTKRKMLNPDGVNIHYSTPITTPDGRKIQAVPVIYSRFDNFQADVSQFMAYMVFEMFEIEEQDGQMTIINPDKGYAPQEISDFWEQIERNTEYIIHPDEVLADNFQLLVYAQKDPSIMRHVDADGQQLLDKLKSILTN